MIVTLAPRWWLKPFGLLHPLFTLSSIIATGNHWFLDAVGGATVVGAGFGLQYLVSGPRAATAAATAVKVESSDAGTAHTDRASSGH